MYYYFQILLNMLDFSLKYTTVSSILREFSGSSIRICVSESTNKTTFSECYLQYKFIFSCTELLFLSLKMKCRSQRETERRRKEERQREITLALSRRYVFFGMTCSPVFEQAHEDIGHSLSLFRWLFTQRFQCIQPIQGWNSDRE